jgi:hypothetical protein
MSNNLKEQKVDLLKKNISLKMKDLALSAARSVRLTMKVGVIKWTFLRGQEGWR